MDSSKDQNSAIVLSFWHCILAWFFADSANEHEDTLRRMKDPRESMMEIYKCMRPLRFAIHGQRMLHPGIPQIAVNFKFMVSPIPHEVWVNELHSLLHEIVSINHVLKEYNKDSLNNPTTLKNVVEIHKHPKHTVCLLTLWYWLAVWSTPGLEQDLDSNHRAKNAFISDMEVHHDMLGFCLVNRSPTVSSSAHDQLQSLFCKLLDMLKSDPQYWTNFMDQFINKMVETGLLRGQVKKVFHAAGVLNPPSALPQSTKEAPAPLVMHMMPRGSIVTIATKSKLASKLGGLLKEGLKQVGINIVLNNVGDLITGFYKDIIGPVGNFLEHIPEELDEFGHEVKEFAIDVYHKVEHWGEKIHDEVKHLAHVIGDGMHKFASGVESAYHEVGHFFSHLFGH